MHTLLKILKIFFEFFGRFIKGYLKVKKNRHFNFFQRKKKQIKKPLKNDYS